MLFGDFRDKRAFFRFKFSQPVELKFDEFKASAGSLSGDLSRGGIQLKFNQFVPLNKQVNLKIHIASELFESVNGKIVWVQKMRYSDRYMIGIQFLEEQPNFTSSEILNGYITKKLNEKLNEQ